MDIKRTISLIDKLLPKDAIYEIKNEINKLIQEQQEMVCEKIQTIAPTLPSSLCERYMNLDKILSIINEVANNNITKT